MSRLGKFLNFIQETDSGCWNWSGHKDKAGYGYFWNGQTNQLAHRWMYEYTSQQNIPDNIVICHSCDNPSCVNPMHLFHGTQKDNIQDSVLKKRKIVGESHVKSKLTVNDVVYIRSSTASLKELASTFGVSMTLISNVRNKKRWKHV